MISRNASLRTDVFSLLTVPETQRTTKTNALHERSGRLFAVAASWSSLCLIRTWIALHQPALVYAFWHESDRRQVDYLAAASACCILTLVLWVALRLRGAEGNHSRIVRVLAELFLLTFACITVNRIQVGLLGELTSMSRLAFVLPVPAVWVLVQRRPAVARLFGIVLVCLSPFAAWNVACAVYYSVDIHPALVSPPVRKAHSSTPADGHEAAATTAASRIVWVIFDEWDGALTFNRRQPGLSLPTLDEFRATAFFASAAQAPGPQTMDSLPAFLLGRPVLDARPAANGSLEVTLASGQGAADLQHYTTLIDRLRDRSVRVGIAGWYLPYRSLFAGEVQTSYSVPYGPYIAPNGGWAKSTAMQFSQLLPNAVRTALNVGSDAKSHRIVYDRIVPVAKTYAADPSLGFVLLHLPVPHLPAIYDRSAGQFRTNSLGLDYNDNLALLDRTLHDLRTAMQQAGTWDSSTVLLSSDHWFRATHHSSNELYNQTPFLLKLKSQSTRVQYDAPFNTVVTGSLLLAIIDGRVTTTEGIGKWLDDHR